MKMRVDNQRLQMPSALSASTATPKSLVANERRRIDPGSPRNVSVLQRPAWLLEDTWPLQTSVLEVEGSRIAFYDVGVGPVILFVHTGFWSFIWRDVILRLQQEFRCICFDAPGAGQSDRLAPSDVSLERAARAITVLIESLNLNQITLVVHDLGGPSGIAGVSQIAHRVRALCVINSFAWKPQGPAFRGMLALLGSTFIRELDALTGIIPRVTATSFGVGRHMDESSRRTFLAGMGSDGARTFHAYMRDAHRADAIYERLAFALKTKFRTIPVCTIFGERNDPLAFQLHWKELFPDCRQIVVPQGNHFPMCDDPDLVARSIRELQRDGRHINGARV
jgi:pimeloyl-ACP methyl ester carboxylesterase